jgi:hypothetical protein
MATLTKPYALGSATHAARVLRNDTAAHFGQPVISHANSVSATTRGGAYGVVGAGDLLVTPTTGLGWSCAAGRVVAVGTSATAQGAYTGLNDAALTGTLSARDATFSRITLICYRVRDTDEDATTFEDDGIIMIDGTASASPAVPSIPSSLGSLVVLSQVTVPPGATAPTYLDVRMRAAALGGTIICKSSTRPTGAALWAGVHIYETDTGFEYVYDGAAWRQTSPVVWSKQATINIANTTTSGLDTTINFGPSPITGIGVVTFNSFGGFAGTTGTATHLMYTNDYAAPGGGGWISYPGVGVTIAAGGTWYGAETVTLNIPLTAGVTPSVVVRLLFTTSNYYCKGSLVLQGMASSSGWTNP